MRELFLGMQGFWRRIFSTPSLTIASARWRFSAAAFRSGAHTWVYVYVRNHFGGRLESNPIMIRDFRRNFCFWIPCNSSKSSINRKATKFGDFHIFSRLKSLRYFLEHIIYQRTCLSHRKIIFGCYVFRQRLTSRRNLFSLFPHHQPLSIS